MKRTRSLPHLFCLCLCALAGGNLYADSTGAQLPSVTGMLASQWANPTNAFADDVAYASEGTNGQEQDYSTFTLNVPAGATIDGIQVSYNAYAAEVSGVHASMTVFLSADAGASYNASYVTANLFTSDLGFTLTLGGGTDLWGQSWSASDFDDANFRLKVRANIPASVPKGGLLLSGDGVYRPVEDFKIGDEVLSCNTDSLTFFKNRIVSLERHGSKKLFILNRQVRVTGSELVYADTEGNGTYRWIAVESLKKGDVILREEDAGRILPAKVDTLDGEEGEFEVYTIGTEKPFNNYWVNHYLFDAGTTVNLDFVKVAVYYTPASSPTGGGPEPSKLMRHGGWSEGGQRKKFSW